MYTSNTYLFSHLDDFCKKNKMISFAVAIYLYYKHIIMLSIATLLQCMNCVLSTFRSQTMPRSIVDDLHCCSVYYIAQDNMNQMFKASV